MPVPDASAPIAQQPRSTPNRYETDFYAWTQEQAALLRNQPLSQIDWSNLIEEIEALGNQQRQELRSRLSILMGHLLRWEYQPQHRMRSWLAILGSEHRDTLRLLKDNPSLKGHFDDVVPAAYEHARDLAMGDTEPSGIDFPPRLCLFLSEPSALVNHS